jgi:aminomethyltransferase
MLKRTPLFEAHQKLGARLVEFGGWEMPVQYSSIVDEHLAVRKSAGLFDISHMGEFTARGSEALDFLNFVLTNDVRKLEVGQGQYTLMCNDRGGVVDDLYIYRTGPVEFLLIVNASRIAADFASLKAHLGAWRKGGDVQLADRSDDFGAVALQGPRSAEFIDVCFPGPSTAGTQVPQPSHLKKNQLGSFTPENREIFIARTGYTGEDGFEVITPAGVIVPVWNRILQVGHAFCLQPAGLGARDTLRTEVCYPLYGHELDEQTTPLEAGLGSFVALDKPEFMGRAVLLDQKTNGVTKRCVAFQMTDKSAPPRPHYPIWSTGAGSSRVGQVVSGTQSPSLGIGIGLGYVPPALAKPGTAIEIEIRGRRWPAAVVAKPIYRKSLTTEAKAG